MTDEPVPPTNGRVVLDDGREVAGTFRYDGPASGGAHRWMLEVQLGSGYTIRAVNAVKMDTLPAKTKVALKRL